MTHGGAAARELRRIAGAALVSRLLTWDLEHQTEGGGGGGTAAAWGPGGRLSAAGDVDDVLDGGGGDRLRAVGSLQREKGAGARSGGYAQIAAAEAASRQRRRPTTSLCAPIRWYVCIRPLGAGRA